MSVASAVERLQTGTRIDDIAAHVFFCSLLERHGFCIDLRMTPPLPAALIDRQAKDWPTTSHVPTRIGVVLDGVLWVKALCIGRDPTP